MPLPSLIGIGGGGQSLLSVLPNRGMHAEAWLVITLIAALHEAGIDERGEPVEWIRIWNTNGAGSREGPAAGKYTEPVKQRPLVRGQQCITPGDRCAHRLLPVGCVTYAASQKRELVVQ